MNYKLKAYTPPKISLMHVFIERDLVLGSLIPEENNTSFPEINDWSWDNTEVETLRGDL